MTQAILPLVGVVIGGIITLIVNLVVETKKANGQAKQRRIERAEVAAQDIATALIDLDDVERSGPHRRKLSTAEIMRAQEDLEKRIKLSTLSLGDARARNTFDEVMDLMDWKIIASGYVKQRCREYLLDCSGSLLRGESIPPLPPVVVELKKDVEDHLRIQIEGHALKEKKNRPESE
jgi:hypothetical protein